MPWQSCPAYENWKAAAVATHGELTNPFIAALLQFNQRPSRAPPSGCRGRSSTATIPLGYDPSSPLNRLSPFWCDETLVYDVAVPILQALLTGDRTDR